MTYYITIFFHRDGEVEEAPCFDRKTALDTFAIFDETDADIYSRIEIHQIIGESDSLIDAKDFN